MTRLTNVRLSKCSWWVFSDQSRSSHQLYQSKCCLVRVFSYSGTIGFGVHSLVCRYILPTARTSIGMAAVMWLMMLCGLCNPYNQFLFVLVFEFPHFYLHHVCAFMLQWDGRISFSNNHVYCKFILSSDIWRVLSITHTLLICLVVVSKTCNMLYFSYMPYLVQGCLSFQSHAHNQLDWPSSLSSTLEVLQLC